MPFAAYRLGDFDKALGFRVAQIHLQCQIVDALVSFYGKRQDQGFDKSRLVDDAGGRNNALARPAGGFNRYMHSRPQ